MRNAYMQGWEGSQMPLLVHIMRVLVHIMLKFALREELFYCNEVITLYLYSWQASGAGCQRSPSEWE